MTETLFDAPLLTKAKSPSGVMATLLDAVPTAIARDGSSRACPSRSLAPELRRRESDTAAGRCAAGVRDRQAIGAQRVSFPGAACVSWLKRLSHAPPRSTHSEEMYSGRAQMVCQSPLPLQTAR